MLVDSIRASRLLILQVNWSEDRYLDIKTQFGVFLQHLGFDPTMVSYIPCSGLTGENVVKLPNPSPMVWYKGNTLLKEMGSLSLFEYRLISRPHSSRHT